MRIFKLHLLRHTLPVFALTALSIAACGGGDGDDESSSDGDIMGDREMGDGDDDPDLGGSYDPDLGGSYDLDLDGNDEGSGSDEGGEGCTPRPTTGQECNPDSCRCEGEFIECRFQEAASSFVCVDQTPQNKPNGASCVDDFECESWLCYGSPSSIEVGAVCQGDCLPEGTEFSGLVSATAADCCALVSIGSTCR